MGLADLADLAHSESLPNYNSLWTSRRPVLLSPSPIPGRSDVPALSNFPSPLSLNQVFGYGVTKSGDVYLCPRGRSSLAKGELYHYSPKDNTITPLRFWGGGPGDLEGHAMALVGNVVAVHGGHGDRSDSSLYLLNLVSREWSRIYTRGDAPAGLASHSMATMDTTIYIFGGYFLDGSNDRRRSNELWAFNLDTLRTQPAWELVKHTSRQRPPPRSGCTLIPFRNQLILFGGYGRYGTLDDVWSFDLKSRGWSELRCTGDIPFPRYVYATAVIDDVLYVFGGLRGNGEIPDDVSALKISDQRWFTLRTDVAPAPRHNHSAVCIGTKIFIFGGVTAKEREDGWIHVFDAKYVDNSNLHTPERLKELDNDFLDTMIRDGWSRAGPREFRYELQMRLAKLGEVMSGNTKLENRVKELSAELLQEKVNTETRIKELNNNFEVRIRELQRDKAKVESWVKEYGAGLQVEVGELLTQNSKLETRIKGLERDTDALKQSLITLLVLGSQSKMDSLACLRGTDAQVMVDFLAEVLETRSDILQSNADRRHILHLLSKLAKSAQVFPRRAELSNVQCNLADPVNDEGGFGFIYKGVFKEQMVCVKTVRVIEPGSKADKLLRAQAGELALLFHVSHPNVIPLYGAYLSNEETPRICIVSPWMENGDLSNYLKKFPDTPPVPLMCDLASGLQFLHGVGIVHADLKARNVLVSRSQRAMLADFGVSTVVHTNVGTTTARDFSGTVFWMAPEQLVPDDEGKMSRPTQQSDLWGFACICFEVLTGEIPFSQHYTPMQLIGAFVKGQVTPLQPRRNGSPTIVNGGPLMELAERCWNYDPSERPSATEVLRFLVEWNVEDDRPSMDKELAMFEAVKSGRAQVMIDYTHILSIVQRDVRTSDRSESLTGETIKA